MFLWDSNLEASDFNAKAVRAIRQETINFKATRWYYESIRLSGCIILTPLAWFGKWGLGKQKVLVQLPLLSKLRNIRLHFCNKFIYWDGLYHQNTYWHCPLPRSQGRCDKIRKKCSVVRNILDRIRVCWSENVHNGWWIHAVNTEYSSLHWVNLNNFSKFERDLSLRGEMDLSHVPAGDTFGGHLSMKISLLITD